MLEKNAVSKSKRARVFALMQQTSQAAAGQARIRKMARQSVSAEDLEQFKVAAMRSLQTGLNDLSAKHS